MSHPAHALEHGAHAEAHEGGHLDARGYIKVALFLAVITIVEVAVYYIEAFHGVLPWILVVLSAVKFATVVGFFMHLKFDSKLFTFLFLGGLLIAGSVVMGLMTLFGTWTQLPLAHPGAGH